MNDRQDLCPEVICHSFMLLNTTPAEKVIISINKFLKGMRRDA